MGHTYKDYVVTEKIKYQGDQANNLRYLLEIPLKTRKEQMVLVIMKNPSLANKNKSDHTINRVLKFCYTKGYSKVFVMNLYAYYSTDPKGIAKLIHNNQEHLAIGCENDSLLLELSKHVDDIIVAWGSNTFGCTSKYKKRIKDVTKLLEGKNLFYVEKVSKCSWYPKHAQVWSTNSGINMHVWKPPF
ncbi:DUF1643 domain-containing protein [Salirhabdus sp. Marseille-P4669]|uniref:DUF1643 domain-containing protein n=1 Tax=Salirhabdus sp. Marseille-P4669 TaxID=2042310 RepID=UPI001359A19D|nr:DUF1643 domain-containing protein [Salirhabdus sp. Marseille-P4669]